MFFRAMRNRDFDIAGNIVLQPPDPAFARRMPVHSSIPVFLSRAFGHTSIYVRKGPDQEARGPARRKIGLPEYQLSECLGPLILESDYGLRPT